MNRVVDFTYFSKGVFHKDFHTTQFRGFQSLILMVLGAAYLNVYSYNRYYSNRHATGNNVSMIQNEQTDSSIRLTGMLMTISLAIIGLLFLYILYNVIMNVAGTAIVILLLIALAFTIVLLKTLKIMDKLTLPPMAADLEYGGRISTIEDLMHQTRNRHDSLPPSYEEATKNSSCSGPTEDRDNILPKYSTVTDCPHCATSILSPSGPRSL